MAVIRSRASLIKREIFGPTSLVPKTAKCLLRIPLPAPASSPFSGAHLGLVSRSIIYCPVRCAPVSNETANGRKNSPARLAQVQEFLVAANERAKAAGDESIAKITPDHVTVNFARSGGPGGQNVNKVNTKVAMWFNVKSADWPSKRVKERIMQMEKNRINKDGELAIIDAASYVPPPLSEETVKKITKLAAIGEQNVLTRRKLCHRSRLLEEARTIGTDLLEHELIVQLILHCMDRPLDITITGQWKGSKYQPSTS